ncbi:T9SS type A sorting domain-containing protein [Chryseobacterium sp. NRRL B-14859]|uniref:T9SS type A sorting domain-containing protein n=1 Tax=Chryseobacterium sp. NRRL B-14859 TaxID=1562763 RepID=UPI0033996088
MRKIYLFFLLLSMQLLWAQFTASDVKYFVGTGDQTAYVVVDFKDGTDDRSYAWGVKYNSGENPKIFNLLQKIQAEEPKFSFLGTSFLNKISFNDHSKQSVPDYWSTWTGDNTQSFQLNGGMSGSVNNEKWYGFSYGFSNPSAQAPVTPIPAYSSNWYKNTQITNWIGTGSNKSLVVIDFGTDNSNGNANSFVFGIQYDGTITAEQALQIIQSHSSYFNFTSANNQVSTLSLNSFTGNSSGSDTWKLYKGNDLSNWKTQTGLSQVQLSNNDWLGLSFGQRRPFTPTEATQSNLGVSSVSKKGVGIYPNPATDYIQIHTEGIKEVNIYAVSGQKVITSQANKVNIQSLSPGLYFVEVKTSTHSTIHKIVKK